MANSLTALSPTYWAKKMQDKLNKELVFRAVASFKEEETLKDGQTVDRPYRSDVVAEDYTKGTALTAQDVTGTSDQLTVNVVKGVLIYIDNVDLKQMTYDTANLYIGDMVQAMSESIDARFLYEVVNANDTIDDGDLGGTAGYGITLTTANILNVFSKAHRKLDEQNVSRKDRFFVISPQFYDILFSYLAGRESQLGDSVGTNGHIGKYAGFELYVSNNLTASARWTPADNPANTATISIQGITFTFVTTIGTTAGNILIGGTTAATIDNLVALINAGGVTSDSGVSNVSLTLANRRKVQNWVAVDGTTYIEVRVKGGSYLTLTTSESADVWTTTNQIQHCLAGRKKAIDAVIQTTPDVDIDSTVSAGKAGKNYLGLTVAGFKTFTKGTKEILNVWIRTDAF